MEIFQLGSGITLSTSQAFRLLRLKRRYPFSRSRVRDETPGDYL